MKIQAGMSLIEQIIIIIILGITAAAVIPNFASTDPERLQLAANRVAEALRYARGESIRTGEAHGVQIDHDGTETSYKDITVYKVDLTTTPFGLERILYHPLDKSPYDLSIGNDPLTRGVKITNSTKVFDIENNGMRKEIHFNALGLPVYYVDSSPNRLLSGEIHVGNGSSELAITLNPVTGRVTIQ